jgi:hypothetical protein
MPRGVPARSVARITFNALLQAAKAIDEAQHLGHHSIVFVAPDIAWVDGRSRQETEWACRILPMRGR